MSVMLIWIHLLPIQVRSNQPLLYDHFKMDFKFSVDLVWDLQFLKLRHPKNDELFTNSLVQMDENGILFIQKSLWNPHESQPLTFSTLSASSSRSFTWFAHGDCLMVLLLNSKMSGNFDFDRLLQKHAKTKCIGCCVRSFKNYLLSWRANWDSSPTLPAYFSPVVVPARFHRTDDGLSLRGSLAQLGCRFGNRIRHWLHLLYF